MQLAITLVKEFETVLFYLVQELQIKMGNMLTSRPFLTPQKGLRLAPNHLLWRLLATMLLHSEWGNY